MGGPRREGPTIPVLAMYLTVHCDTYDSFLDHMYGVLAEYIMSRKTHSVQSTGHKAQKRKKRGFSPFLGGRKLRNQGPDRDKQKTQILGTEPSRKNIWISISRGRKGLVEDRLNVFPSNDMYPLWCCTCTYKYKYKYVGSPYI